MHSAHRPVEQSIIMGSPFARRELIAGGSVLLTSTNGSILDGGDSATDVTGAGVLLSAVNGSLGLPADGLSLSADSLTTDTSTGGDYAKTAHDLAVRAGCRWLQGLGSAVSPAKPEHGAAIVKESANSCR